MTCYIAVKSFSLSVFYILAKSNCELLVWTKLRAWFEQPPAVVLDA